MSEVAERSPIDIAIGQLRSPEFLTQLEAALPETVSVDRFARVTMTALRERPELALVDRVSLFNAVVRCAQDGLLPDGHEAALVEFNTKKDGPKATYMPMIGGYRKIAAEHGWSIRTQVVREGEPFEFDEANAEVKHRRSLSIGSDIVGAWALGVHRDGRRELVVMGRDEIEQIRKVSRTSNAGPWVEWFSRMAEKTVGRRLFKKLPLDGKDRERIIRVLRAEESVDAAAELYGPEARRALGSGDASLDAGAATSGPIAAAPVQEQEEAVDPTDPEPPPAPSEFEGDEPAPAPQQSEDEIIAAAGAVVIGAGNYEGSTIAEVAETDPAYLKWVAEHWSTEPVKGAAVTYAMEKGIIE